ncbi:MAG TPA: molecular chaperone DnaJ [Chthoniobacteraceae bacterium]|nr:molecular chaperone DnaJ [Chthoniobacteraceae bacterium]
MPKTKRDYYEVLEIDRTVTVEEIKKAYRRLAVKHHPDKNPDDPQAEERFKELGEAYDVLSDENKRAAYDRYGHAAFAQGTGPGAQGFHDPFDLFREMFGQGGGGGGIFEQFFGGGGGGRGDRSGRQRGSDLRYDMQIKLEEAAFGVEKEIEISRLDTCEKCGGRGAEEGSSASTCPTCRGQGQVITSRGFFQVSQTCPNCRGSGQIIAKPCKVCHGDGRVERASHIKLKIPAGIEHGSRLRSVGNGEAGIRGGARGDLYVVIHVKEHAVFDRQEENLFCEVPVSFITAALGGEVKVPTLEGKAALKIPAGTQSATVFKLRGKGMPVLNSSSRGDLMVRVLVEVPTKLNTEQRAKLEEFAKVCGEENSPIHKSFFEKAKEFFK